MDKVEALYVVETALTRATNLPVSYVVVHETLSTLRVALDKLAKFETVQKCDALEKGEAI